MTGSKSLGGSAAKKRISDGFPQGAPEKALEKALGSGEAGEGGSLFSIAPAPCVIWHHSLGLSGRFPL